MSERAKKGLFLSFQNPVEVPGISLENFVRSAISQKTGKPVRVWSFRKEVKAALETLDMDPSYAERDLNVGFSGGEKKKAEILQLLLLKPSLAILDETDSGLDVDAVRTVSKGIEAFQADKSASLLIITHNAAILSALKVDAVHILAGGKIVAEGGWRKEDRNWSTRSRRKASPPMKGRHDEREQDLCRGGRPLFLRLSI